MYPVSEAYKTAIRARTRTDRVTGTLTLTDGTVLPLTAAELMSGSLTLDKVRHGGRAGLRLRLPRAGGAQPAHGAEPPCLLRRKALPCLRAAAAGRPVGGGPARQLYRGRGRAQGAVCQHQGV